MSARAAVDALASQTERSLKQKLTSDLPPLFPRTPQSLMTTVHKLRTLAGARAAGSRIGYQAKRAQALEAVTVYFTDRRTDGRQRLRPEDLGMGAVQTAELYIDTMEGVSPRLFAGLPRTSPHADGREGIFNGILFQRLMLNLRPLHAELGGIARGQRGELNRLLRTPGALIGLDGVELRLPPGSFEPPVLATEFWLGRGRGDGGTAWEEFVDGGYVSRFTPARGRLEHPPWAPILSLEIKRAVASSQFGRQLGENVGRLTDPDVRPDRIRFRLPGTTEWTVVEAADLVFDPANRWLVGATASATGRPELGYAFTRRGGYQESYLRMGVVLETIGVDDLSALLFRAVPP